LKIYLTLPTFLDVHSIGTLTEEDLIKEQNAPRDELGVKTVNILYNLEGGVIYCLLDAPEKEAVEKHHDKIGVKCDWIMEVKTTQKT
jgi:Nickel responsive protein SCO4226-like